MIDSDIPTLGNVQIIEDAVGKQIELIGLNETQLRFEFSDGTKVMLEDDPDDYDYRYMHTDDSLIDFVGSKFRGVELRDGPTEEPAQHDEVRDSQFLIVHTSIGDFTIVNYIEHSGYYGGFRIAVVRQD